MGVGPGVCQNCLRRQVPLILDAKRHAQRNNDMFLILDALRMIRDIRTKGRAIRIWGALLNMTQVLGGIVFIRHLEGQVVLATAIFTLVVAGQIHKKAPFSRLTGVCHLPWLIMLPWLTYRLQTVEHSAYFSIWGYIVVVLVAVSLVFDVIDVYRYTKGRKTFSWESGSH